MGKPDSNVVSIEREVSLDFIRDSSGFAVKVIKGQKAPARGWDPRANTEAKSVQLIADLRDSEDNFGIHLHGELVDVDIDTKDHPQLLAALDILLPDCPHIWGRRERPRTHRVYQIRTDTVFDPVQHPFLKRLARIPEANVEVRGGPTSRGEYSLMPPSIHPSNDVYVWSDISAARNTPAVVDLDLLLRRIRMAGAVSVMCTFWAEGVRQELAMALAGFIHRASSIAQSLDDKLFHLTEEEGVMLLHTIMEVSGDDVKDVAARRKAFSATWRKAQRGLPVTGATTIAELAGDKAVVNKLYALLSENPDTQALDEFTSRFAIWQGPALVVDMEQAAKGVHKPLLTRRNFASSFAHRYIYVNGKRLLLAELMWGLEATTRIQGLTFVPGEKDLVVSDREGDKLNQWTGFEVEPAKQKVKDKDVKPLLSYLYDVVCSGNDNHYRWVLGWMADIFQNPADKCGTALGLVGLPGAGKSILGHLILGKIIGATHYVATNSVNNVTKNFNTAFACKIMIQCDEATSSRQKTEAARLKSLITDPIQMVEPKGVDAYFLPLHARFLFTSNEVETALYLNDGADDRRYTVLEVSPKYKDAVADYWHPLVEWLKKDDTLAKIHRYLLDHKYERAYIQRPLVTAAKNIMQQSSWDIVDAWLATMLARNHPLSEEAHIHWHDAIPPDFDNSKDINREQWPTEINMTAMLRCFNIFQRENSKAFNGRNVNEVTLAQLFKKRQLRPNDASRRITITEFDPRIATQVTKRIRLYPAPEVERITNYLDRKYGFKEGDPAPTDDDFVTKDTEVAF